MLECGQARSRPRWSCDGSPLLETTVLGTFPNVSGGETRESRSFRASPVAALLLANAGTILDDGVMSIGTRPKRLDIEDRHQDWRGFPLLGDLWHQSHASIIH